MFYYLPISGFIAQLSIVCTLSCFRFWSGRGLLWCVCYLDFSGVVSAKIKLKFQRTTYLALNNMIYGAKFGGPTQIRLIKSWKVYSQSSQDSIMFSSVITWCECPPQVLAWLFTTMKISPSITARNYSCLLVSLIKNGLASAEWNMVFLLCSVRIRSSS